MGSELGGRAAPAPEIVWLSDHADPRPAMRCGNTDRSPGQPPDTAGGYRERHPIHPCARGQERVRRSESPGTAARVAGPVRGAATRRVDARGLRSLEWDEHEHLDSEIRFVTPAQRHSGEDIEILELKRPAVYKDAQARHPERWSRNIRHWSRPQEVCLNPQRTHTASEVA